MSSPHQRLVELLTAAARPFEVLRHPAAVSAVDAAVARGTELSVGGKSILMRVERIGLVVAVVGSDRRLDGKAFRRALGVQRYRFGSDAELLEAGGLQTGEVPAFGRPLWDVELVVGADLLERPELVFAAADRTASIRMATVDWVEVARPRVVAPFTVS